MTARTVQPTAIPVSAPSMLEAPSAPGALPQPRLVPHHEAKRSPVRVVRLTAQALSTITGLVHCRLALFWSVTPRSEVADAVVLEDASQDPATSVDAGFYRPPVQSVDPFAPRRAARMGASLLTVDDAGGALRLANSAYGRHLDRAGLEHQVALYFRAAGGLRAMIALFRARGAPDFDRDEIRALRQLHPLIAHAYANSVGSNPAGAPSPPMPALTPREAEVAALIALGASNAEIATALTVEQATVKAHLSQIYAKFGLRSRTQLALRLNTGGQQAPGALR